MPVVIAYVAVIAAANIITAATTPADIGPFLVTWGTWLIGFTFILRDVVQLQIGRKGAYRAIAAGLLVAAGTSAVLGDTLAIVVGSALAFAVSESLDTEVFSRMAGKLPARVAISGLVASPIDSIIFCIIGLSPLWSGIVPWSALPNLILGQIIVKGVLQILAAGTWRIIRGPEPLPEAAR